MTKVGWWVLALANKNIAWDILTLKFFIVVYLKFKLTGHPVDNWATLQVRQFILKHFIPVESVLKTDFKT